MTLSILLSEVYQRHICRWNSCKIPLPSAPLTKFRPRQFKSNLIKSSELNDIKSCALNDTFYAPVGIIKEFLDQMTSAKVLNYFRKGHHFGKLSLAKVLK